MPHPAPFVLNHDARIKKSYAIGKLLGGQFGHYGTRQQMLAHIGEVLGDRPQECALLLTRVHLAATDQIARDLIGNALNAEVQRLQDDLTPITAERANLDRLLEATKDVIAWLGSPLSLGSVAESEFHRVTPKNLMCIAYDLEFRPPEVAQAQSGGNLGVFLIQHDWASLLDGSEVDAGSYRLPFDFNVFEFAIGGRRVIALVCCEQGEPYRLIPIVRAKGGWIIATSYDVRGPKAIPEAVERDEKRDVNLPDMLMSHVRAIAITLDAEVVASTIHRAPHRSNAALKRGAQAPYDFHLLSLARRANSPRRLDVVEGRHGVRLHFRRGHWRHYQTHKTWIKWCLVGDPSLGFADKDYAL